MFHPQIVTEIISAVGTKQKTDTIFAFSKNHFDLHQFNVGGLYPKDVRKMNQSLKRRYKHNEIEILPTSWNEGERRLFIWFIICFLYEKKVEIKDITEKELEELSKVFYGKSTIFLDFQLKNLPKVTKAKRNWSSEEDQLLKAAIQSLRAEGEDTRQFNNWNDVAKIMFFQTERRIFRSPKSCRERWYNHLDESKKKDEFSLQEDLVLLNYILTESKSWSKVVKVLDHSRTEHRIKNRYYTLIRKYLKNTSNCPYEELTEETERKIVLAIKANLEAQRDGIELPEEIPYQRENIEIPKVKAEEEVFRMEEAEEEEKQNIIICQNSNQSAKVKTQTDPQQLKSLKAEEDEPKSYNISAEIKDNSHRTDPVENYEPSQPSANYWPDMYAPYSQFYYHMGSYTPHAPEMTSSAQTPIIINQFYCPIIIQNGADFQMLYQN